VTTDSGSPIPTKPAIEVTTDSGPTTNTTVSAWEPYRGVEEGLSNGRNAMSIWQQLVDQSGFTGAYESVERFVRKQRGAHSPDAYAVIVTAPGEEAQVDYGKGPPVRDPKTGKHGSTRLFVLTLGFSRKCVRLLSFQSSSRIWCELHETAFRRLGGTPRVLVLDNLSEGVISPDYYDPVINPLYRDLLTHYNAVALPCRVRDPDRKGKVESGVGYAKRTPLKGQRFDSLEEAQTYLDQWETRWAERIHGTTKRQVSAMFAEQKPALKPLPLEPFRFYHYGERTVHLDGCVEVEAADYSVPPGRVSRVVHVQWDSRFVRILDPKTGQLLRENIRQQRGRHQIKDEDRSKRTSLGVLQLLARATKAGERIGVFCVKIHELQSEAAVRRIQGILSFVKKYGAARVEDACATALDLKAYDYGFVKRYLKRTVESPVSLLQVDPLIRQLTLYRDLIAEKTKETDQE
jgi:transposase